MHDLTIVIPVRRMAGKLKQLEVSISEALLAGYNVIVVHDKADEDTEVELRLLAEKQKLARIQLITGVYNSPGGARNAGTMKVRTKWVTFWDADDRPVVENLTKLYEILKGSDADIGVGGYKEINSIDPTGFRTHLNESLDLNSIALAPGIWRMIFRTELIMESPFKKWLLAEDQVLLSDLKIAKRKIVFSNVVIYNYLSGNPESLTGQNRKIEDLVGSISHIQFNIENEVNFFQREFDWIMLAKQSLTLLKYGSNRNRIFASRQLSRFALRAPWKSRQAIFLFIFRKGRLDG